MFKSDEHLHIFSCSTSLKIFWTTKYLHFLLEGCHTSTTFNIHSTYRVMSAKSFSWWHCLAFLSLPSSLLSSSQPNHHYGRHRHRCHRQSVPLSTSSSWPIILWPSSKEKKSKILFFSFFKTLMVTLIVKSGFFKTVMATVINCQAFQ